MIYVKNVIFYLSFFFKKRCSSDDLSFRQPLPPLPPQPESMIRTTKYFDAPTIYQKPVRIVKAVQRSVPPKINYETNIHLSSEYMRNLFPKSDRYRQNSGNRQSVNTTNQKNKSFDQFVF